MAPASQYCVVTIGVDHFLVPLKDGTRLVDILSRAVPLKHTYSSGRPFFRVEARETNRVELSIVRAGDVDASTVAPRGGSRVPLLEGR